jgi:hypothetical protein
MSDGDFHAQECARLRVYNADLRRQLAEARADGYWEQHSKRIEGELEQARERAATLRIALGGMIQAAEIAVETNPCACEEDGMCGVCIGAMRLPAAHAALDAGKGTDISRDMAMLAAFESGYQTAQAEYEETGRVAGMKQPVAGVE